MKVYKPSFLILCSTIFLLYSCSKTSDSRGNKGIPYSENVKTIVEDQVTTDSQKIEIMDTYNTLGGFKASEERGEQACEKLREGKPIEDVIQITLHSINWEIDLANLPAFAKNESEVEELMRTRVLYESEVRAAQNTMCPETRVELKF